MTGGEAVYSLCKSGETGGAEGGIRIICLLLILIGWPVVRIDMTTSRIWSAAIG